MFLPEQDSLESVYYKYDVINVKGVLYRAKVSGPIHESIDKIDSISAFEKIPISEFFNSMIEYTKHFTNYSNDSVLNRFLLRKISSDKIMYIKDQIFSDFEGGEYKYYKVLKDFDAGSNNFNTIDKIINAGYATEFKSYVYPLNNIDLLMDWKINAAINKFKSEDMFYKASTILFSGVEEWVAGKSYYKSQNPMVIHNGYIYYLRNVNGNSVNQTTFSEYLNGSSTLLWVKITRIKDLINELSNTIDRLKDIVPVYDPSVTYQKGSIVQYEGNLYYNDRQSTTGTFSLYQPAMQMGTITVSEGGVWKNLGAMRGTTKDYGLPALVKNVFVTR